MSFAFNQSGGGGGGGGASSTTPAANVGADVPAILAEELSFKALSQGAEGPKKLKILPTPWPTDDVPPASVTLLSIAAKPGLLAAAGPDTLVLASTQKIRGAFQDKAGEWDVISDFTPDATMPVPKLRHVAFSAEGDFLVISAENEGGLAVFDPTELLKQNFKPGNQIDTGKVAVRSLLPNPAPQMEHIFAAVLDDGKFCIIDVAKGVSNTIRAEGVVCAAWSTKGKALAVGLKDGTGVLYLNDGTQKGTIPRPPGINEGFTCRSSNPSIISLTNNRRLRPCLAQQRRILHRPLPQAVRHRHGRARRGQIPLRPQQQGLEHLLLPPNTRRAHPPSLGDPHTSIPPSPVSYKTARLGARSKRHAHPDKLAFGYHHHAYLCYQGAFKRPGSRRIHTDRPQRGSRSVSTTESLWRGRRQCPDWRSS
jgi:hypothetical protein